MNGTNFVDCKMNVNWASSKQKSLAFVPRNSEPKKHTTRESLVDHGLSKPPESSSSNFLDKEKVINSNIEADKLPPPAVTLPTPTAGSPPTEGFLVGHSHSLRPNQNSEPLTNCLETVFNSGSEEDNNPPAVSLSQLNVSQPDTLLVPTCLKSKPVPLEKTRIPSTPSVKTSVSKSNIISSVPTRPLQLKEKIASSSVLLSERDNPWSPKKRKSRSKKNHDYPTRLNDRLAPEFFRKPKHEKNSLKRGDKDKESSVKPPSKKIKRRGK